MKKNTGLGLAILAVLIIVAVVLWQLYLGGSPQVGPGPGATAKPSVTPPAAAPEAKQPALPETPASPPIKLEPSPGIAPLQEPSPPATHITIPPPPAMQEHYGILVGSYGNYGEAAKLLAKLKKQGKAAFVQRDPRNPNLFQVWLGPFSSQAEARAAEKEMHARLKKPLKIEQIENPVPK
jgi:cell division septation protein DedD